MIHLRMFYYLGTGIITFGISLIIISLLKKEILNKMNISFILFYVLSSMHLVLIFFNLYFRYNIESSFNPDFILKIAVMISRIRIVFYIAFVHSLSGSNKHKILHYSILTLVTVGSIISSTITTLIAVIYFFIFLVYLFVEKDEINNKNHILIKYFLIISSITLIPFILDLFEELGLFMNLLNLDFFPFCLIALGIIFVVTILRNNKITKLSYKIDKKLVTNRESEIIENILQGLTNKNIAEKLFISESTVKKHINSIFRKLQIKSRWELSQLADKT
ncbi:MAG: LuxR C-terminal-related transcriptional regulator [Spirochaetaceae bacterium]